MPAPLLGHNLVRLLYLDEAGRDRRAPFIHVAGVLVHGDQQHPEIERRIGALIDRYVTPPERVGFVFHATDIFHGTGYFDRRKEEWSEKAKRHSILDDLASIIGDLSLPVVFGVDKKDSQVPDDLLSGRTRRSRADLLHDIAIMGALVRADAWLERYAPDELAVVIHEDVPRNKDLIKASVRVARSEELLAFLAQDEEEKTPEGIPLKRIIDTVFFAEKGYSRPLQLADLCAFILARGATDKEVPAKTAEIVFRHLRWAISSSERRA